MIGKAKEFATKAHGSQTWAKGYPYTVHLAAVAGVIYTHFDNEPICTVLMTAAWLHDTVEDTDVTIDQIREEFGTTVANLVHAVTNEPGKNRKERHEKTYPKIKAIPYATALKVADRIVNVRESLDEPKFFAMYLKEYPGFRAALYDGQFDDMWQVLDDLMGFKR